jgi:hypothetical protein
MTGLVSVALVGAACSAPVVPPVESSSSALNDPIRCGPPETPVTGFADVTDHAFAGGADPTGERDSSDAFRAAVATDKPVYVPPGTYTYLGPGLDHKSPHIVGAGQTPTTINLGADTTFIDSNQRWWSLTLKGIRFNGGSGHVRNRYEGVNVNDYQVVTDCAFIGYSRTSISTNSVDGPYWKIERNIFRANNFHSSMGIALNGWTDGSSIANNSFLRNRVHVKLARGGNNTYIANCDFLRFGPPEGYPRIDVWFTPAPNDVNCGGGMVLTRCKFGNENLDPADFKIVYADEGEGAAFGERWPRLDVESSGWIGGHTVTNVFTNLIGDAVVIPLVRSTTPNIVGCSYGPVTVTGSGGSPILSTMSRLYDDGRSNVFGPLLRANAYTSPLPDLVVRDHP